jgi:hypothetical protein
MLVGRSSEPASIGILEKTDRYWIGTGKLAAQRDLQDQKQQSNLGGSHVLAKRSNMSRTRTA